MVESASLVSFPVVRRGGELGRVRHCGAEGAALVMTSHVPTPTPLACVVDSRPTVGLLLMFYFYLPRYCTLLVYFYIKQFSVLSYLE